MRSAHGSWQSDGWSADHNWARTRPARFYRQWELDAWHTQRTWADETNLQLNKPVAVATAASIEEKRKLNPPRQPNHAPSEQTMALHGKTLPAKDANGKVDGNKSNATDSITIATDSITIETMLVAGPKKRPRRNSEVAQAKAASPAVPHLNECGRIAFLQKYEGIDHEELWAWFVQDHEMDG